MQKTPKDILQQYWGFENFKEPQEAIITAVLQKQHVLALLPTGGGKSVCYQIPALINEGICIVVSPLIALMQDQVQQLKQKGIKAIALTGGLSFSEIDALLDNCIYGNYKFLYLSPERLQQELVQQRIQQMPVNLIAIDEAHCISQWGNDFRPAYLNCNVLRSYFPEVPTIALTATATPKVVKDITKQLEIEEATVFKKSFGRKNISLQVLFEEDKNYRLYELLKESSGASIVYVRNRKATKDIASFLAHKGLQATYYHGGLSSEEKNNQLQLWLSDAKPIMVATNAFGMGIDKPNVRNVIHTQLPDSLESYYQEAGRAGRDGNPSNAVVITNKADIIRVKNQFLSILPDVSFIKLLYKKLNSYFQISYGEGLEETYRLHFNKFCETYKLKTMLTHNGLRLLDRHSIIQLSENFSKRATLQFIISNRELFYYIERNPSLESILKTILRTYGGILDAPTKINTLLITKKANTTEKAVFTALEQLARDQIVNYKAQHTDIELVFLVPREDDKTINVIAKHIKQHNELRTQQVASVIKYVENNMQCKSVQLLSYFGETNVQPCGNCSICTNNTEQTTESHQTIKSSILLILKEQPLSSREIMTKLSYNEVKILEVLRSLLDEEIISINATNKYYISK